MILRILQTLTLLTSSDLIFVGLVKYEGLVDGIILTTRSDTESSLQRVKRYDRSSHSRMLHLVSDHFQEDILFRAMS